MCVLADGRFPNGQMHECVSDHHPLGLQCFQPLAAHRIKNQHKPCSLHYKHPKQFGHVSTIGCITQNGSGLVFSGPVDLENGERACSTQVEAIWMFSSHRFGHIFFLFNFLMYAQVNKASALVFFSVHFDSDVLYIAVNTFKRNRPLPSLVF